MTAMPLVHEGHLNSMVYINTETYIYTTVFFCLKSIVNHVHSNKNRPPQKIRLIKSFQAISQC